MRLGIETKVGLEIPYWMIKKILRILQKHIDEESYEEYFSNVKDIYSFADSLKIDYEYMTLVMGMDWFIIYEDRPESINLVSFYAYKNKDKTLQRALEMKRSLIKIILENKEKIFTGCLRHQTSYRLFKYALEKGYIDGTVTGSVITADESIKGRILNTMVNLVGTNEKLLEKIPYYDEVGHNVEFWVTSQFIENYTKSKNNTRTRRR